ncbi:MAG: zinc ribbon domain-containing protein [Clostridium sp.]|nr:zinc ribbon domain-containing protein [Clostridium sp.]
MTTCPKCNKELIDGAQFCDSCGAKIFETIFCSNCGNLTSTEAAFCQHCGASIAEAPQQEQPTTVLTREQLTMAHAPEQPAPAPIKQKKNTTKKKFPKKAVIFGGIGVAAVAAIIVVAALFLGKANKKTESNYALYLKDSEIFFSGLKKDNEPQQLTSKLIDLDDAYSDYFDIDNEFFADEGEDIGSYTYISEDDKYIFFPDKIDVYGGFNIYYKETTAPESEAVKIDSDILSYTVNNSATIVTYLKGDEGNLYQYKIGEAAKDKLASNVKNYTVSSDGQKIVYINSENSIYLKRADQDKEKLASDISSLEYVNKDFTIVYYIKDGSLYKQTSGDEKVKLASDVYDVLKIYDSGEIYYLTKSSETNALMNYVTDDMADADASFTEPVDPGNFVTPPMPYRKDYATDEEYDAAYAAYEAEYNAALEQYSSALTEYEAAQETYAAKAARDELREALKAETLKYDNYSLCYYNGKEETVITDAYVYGSGSSDYTVAADAPVIVYKAYSKSEPKTVKLSELDDIYDIYDVKAMVEKALYSSSELYVAVKSTATVIEQEKEADNFIINAPGTDIYYLDDIHYASSSRYSTSGNGTLYHISIANGVAKKPELYDSDVTTDSYNFISDSQVAYFKDYKNGKGDFYINKNEIDYDVNDYNIRFYANHNKMFYITDSNSKGYGTLKVYQNNESITVADDIYDCSIKPDGRVLYLYDYSLKYHTGELHEWNNGETRKIDDDVIDIVPISTSRYKGNEKYYTDYDETEHYGNNADTTSYNYETTEEDD